MPGTAAPQRVVAPPVFEKPGRRSTSRHGPASRSARIPMAPLPDVARRHRQWRQSFGLRPGRFGACWHRASQGPFAGFEPPACPRVLGTGRAGEKVPGTRRRPGPPKWASAAPNPDKARNAAAEAPTLCDTGAMQSFPGRMAGERGPVLQRAGFERTGGSTIGVDMQCLACRPCNAFHRGSPLRRAVQHERAESVALLLPRTLPQGRADLLTARPTARGWHAWPPPGSWPGHPWHARLQRASAPAAPVGTAVRPKPPKLLGTVTWHGTRTRGSSKRESSTQDQHAGLRRRTPRSHSQSHAARARSRSSRVKMKVRAGADADESCR